MAHKLLKMLVLANMRANVLSQQMRNVSGLQSLNGIIMKSIIKYLAAVASGLVGTTGLAIAGPVFNVPEAGSLALVGVALVVLVAVSRAGKK